jgi:hypothetical protein
MVSFFDIQKSALHTKNIFKINKLYNYLFFLDF